jgi:hypothetical protein
MLPLGFFGLFGFYFLNYKPLNKFIIYENGFFERFGKKYLYFSEIKSFEYYYLKFNGVSLHIYKKDGSHEWYPGLPKKDIKKIKRIFTNKGIPLKK